MISEKNINKNVFYKTNRYGKYSITVSAVESWNKIQNQLKNTLRKDLSPNKTKIVDSTLSSIDNFNML